MKHEDELIIVHSVNYYMNMGNDIDNKPGDELAKMSMELATESASDLTEFDKNYFLVTLGILAFSVAFISDIVDVKNSAALSLLYLSWVLIAAAVGFILIAFLALSYFNNALHAKIKKYLLTKQNSTEDKEATKFWQMRKMSVLKRE